MIFQKFFISVILLSLYSSSLISCTFNNADLDARLNDLEKRLDNLEGKKTATKSSEAKKCNCVDCKCEACDCHKK